MINNNKFLMKLNKEQFQILFPIRENTITTINLDGSIESEIMSIPDDCILCNYGCNKNIINDEYFYLLMIDFDLSQGSVCKDCKESYFNELEIIDFKEIYERKFPL